MSYRNRTYYWKCDRPSAFHGINQSKNEEANSISKYLDKLMEEEFGTDGVTLKSGDGQGNHLTYIVQKFDKKYFIRIENGPEKDNYMDVESHVIHTVGNIGVPISKVFKSDASHQKYPFAFQILEYISYPNLNEVYKSGDLDMEKTMFALGEYIAKWQMVKPLGYGPFDPEHLQMTGELRGFHVSYTDYFYLNLDEHLDFLVAKGFFSSFYAEEIYALLKVNEAYLENSQGCLVHKDLALWNVLGDEREIKVIIDWDDSIVGDPTDDLSLLACFHTDKDVQNALRGYCSVKELPSSFHIRFYMHLLRNMLVKAVIRVGAGYFEKNDGFFLFDSEGSGGDLAKLTKDKIQQAINMLKKEVKFPNL